MEILNAHVESIREYLNEESLAVQEAGAKAFSNGDAELAGELIRKLKRLEALREGVEYIERKLIELDSAAGEFQGARQELLDRAEEVLREGPPQGFYSRINGERKVVEPLESQAEEVVAEPERKIVLDSETLAEFPPKERVEPETRPAFSKEDAPLSAAAPGIQDRERKQRLEMLQSGKQQVTHLTNKLVDAVDQGYFSEAMYKSAICRARGMIELGRNIGTSVTSIQDDIDMLKQRFNANMSNPSFFGLNFRRELPYDQWLEFSDAYEWMAYVPKAIESIDRGLVEIDGTRTSMLLQCAASTTLIRALLSELPVLIKDAEQFQLEGVLRGRDDMPFIRWWRSVALADEIPELQDYASMLPESVEKAMNRRLEMSDLATKRS